MDSEPTGPSPAVRVTVLLKLVTEGYQDAFGLLPEWLELPATEYGELRDATGPDRFAKVVERAGLRTGTAVRAGGLPGVVSLTDAAITGVPGLMGQGPIPPDVRTQETDEGPGYAVPDTWFEIDRGDGTRDGDARSGDGTGED